MDERRITELERASRGQRDDLADIKVRVDKLENAKSDLMSAITRHVDDAVASSMRKGLEPLVRLDSRVERLEKETEKQTPIIQSTHDAVLTYQATEHVRVENREVAQVDYASKLSRLKWIVGVILTLLTILAGLIGAAISSNSHGHG